MHYQISPETTIEAVKFKSSELGTFSADIFIPPNTIDFTDIFGNFGGKLGDSPVVLAVIILFYVIFILVAILAHRADRKDDKRVRFIKMALKLLI